MKIEKTVTKNIKLDKLYRELLKHGMKCEMICQNNKLILEAPTLDEAVINSVIAAHDATPVLHDAAWWNKQIDSLPESSDLKILLKKILRTVEIRTPLSNGMGAD